MHTDLDCWQNLDWGALKKSLDEEATKIAARQEESNTSRKHLVEQCLELKSKLDKETLDGVTPLLRIFQTEVDALSKRCRASDTAFLNVYKTIADLPNPMDEKSEPSAKGVNDENLELKTKIQTQEILLCRLQSRIAELEHHKEALIQSKLAVREREIHEQYVTRERHLQESQLVVVGKLAESERKNSTLQQLYTQAENEVVLLRKRVKDLDNGGWYKSEPSPRSPRTPLSSTISPHQGQRHSATSPQYNTAYLRPRSTNRPENVEPTARTGSGDVLELSKATADNIPMDLSRPGISTTSTSKNPSRHRSVSGNSSSGSTARAMNEFSAIVRPTSPARTHLMMSEIPNGDSTTVTNKYPVVTSSPERLDVNFHNMDAFATLDLNTMEVSRRIREVLCAHSIGQRVFAKYVLGLSQGTVSELLSKPKPWEKLTEKGRDSYRKMQGWVADMGNIQALKAINPKKGFSGCYTPRQPEDSHTEERVNQILQEAQKAMSAKGESGTPTPHLDSVDTGKRQYLPRGADTTMRRDHSSDYERAQSEEVVKRIYKEELLKLAETARAAGNLAESALYEDELVRLETNQAPTLGGAGGRLGFGERSYVKHDRGDYLFHSIVKFEPQDKDETEIRSADDQPNSPLAQMQQIANSLIDNTSLDLGVIRSRTLKPVLPPVSQEQVDRYSNLNTDSLVRRVKNTLAKFSISQRTFGENVLGLSQGSVSDMLARPKPWHLLTQKGREPFIRMAIFLDDDLGVKKLMENQYSLPGDQFIAGVNEATARAKELEVVETKHSEVNAMQIEKALEAISTEHRATEPPANKSEEQGPKLKKVSRTTSVTDDEDDEALDTMTIAKVAKEVLHQNLIGQKVFGDVVLNMSAGSVSDILSKPKPWEMLGRRGKEPYVKINAWLQEPDAIHVLKAHQADNAAENALKRKHQIDTSSSETPGKKVRILFTEDQKADLFALYKKNPYPLPSQVEELSTKLGCTTKSITNWFHNHRMRSKSTLSHYNKKPMNSNQNSTSSPGSPVSTSEEPANFEATSGSERDFPVFPESISEDMSNGAVILAASDDAEPGNQKDRKERSRRKKSNPKKLEMEIDGSEEKITDRKETIRQLETALNNQTDWESDERRASIEKIENNLHSEQLENKEWAF